MFTLSVDVMFNEGVRGYFGGDLHRYFCVKCESSFIRVIRDQMQQCEALLKI